MSHLHYAGLALLSGMLVGVLPGQAFVLPSLFASTQGNDPATTAFPINSAQPAHTQYVYATSDAPVTANVLKGMSFRKSTGQPLPPQATASIRVELSIGQVQVHTVTSAFAQNHGPNRVVVFQGTVQLPASTSPGPPYPFEVPILFTTPFSFDPRLGPGFIVDLYLFSSTPMGGWIVDGANRDTGKRFPNGPHSLPQCNFSNASPRPPGRDRSMSPGPCPTAPNSTGRRACARS